MKRASISDLENFRYNETPKRTVIWNRKKQGLVNLPYEIMCIICDYSPNERALVIECCRWFLNDKICKLNPLLNKDQTKALKRTVLGRKSHMLVLGAPGTGKSFFIHCLKDLLTWMGKTFQVVAKSALAAQSVGGVTLERFFGRDLFRLCEVWDDKRSCPREDFRPKETLKLRHQRVDFLIVDEASMISDIKLDQMIFLNPKTRIVMVGDVKQLPPIENRPMFTLSDNIFHFDFNVLMTVMRQTASTTEGESYLKFIDDIGNSQYSSARPIILERLAAFNMIPIPMHLEMTFVCATNAHVKRQNERCYAVIDNPEMSIRLGEPKFTRETRILLKGKPKRSKEARIVESMSLSDISVAKKELRARIGFSGSEIVTFKAGCRVIVTHNIEKYELYNGTICTLLAISDTLVSLVEDLSGRKLQYELHEVSMILSTEYVHTKNQITVVEVHAAMSFYPFTLAFAITVHKAQGQTLGKMVIDIPYSIGEGLEYVAVSRCKNLSDMFIKSFPIKWKKINMNERLNKLLSMAP